MGVAAVGIELGEHRPGVHRARLLAALVLLPAALPESGGAGVVEGVEPPQQPQRIHRRLKQAGVQEVLVKPA
jgi:hypothetical protein